MMSACRSVVLALATILCVASRDSVVHSALSSPRHFDEEEQGGECAASNVFYPHNCHETECTLAVTWKECDEWVCFNLTAKTQGDSVWIALGFSEEGKMASSDIATCWYYHHQFQFHRGWTSDIGHSFEIDDKKMTSSQYHSANYTNGMFSCSFRKHKNLLNTSSFREKPLSQNWHILLAWGQLRSGKPISMTKHAEKFSTSCTCNVTDCSKMCLCVNQFKYLLLKLHGSVMTVVFVFLLPLASLVARHYRQVFADSWFKSHMSLMTAGVIGMILGLGFILGHTGGVFSVGPHQLIGIIAIGAAVVQVVVAMFRPHVGDSLKRKLFVAFHRINAMTVLLLGITSLFLGAWYLHHRHKIALIWMEALLGISVVSSLLIFVSLEIKNKMKLYRTIAPLVKYQKLGQPSSNETESEEEVYVKEEEVSKDTRSTPYFSEKVIFLLFILQSFTMTGLLSAFVFYEVPKK